MEYEDVRWPMKHVNKLSKSRLMTFQDQLKLSSFSAKKKFEITELTKRKWEI